MSCVVFPLSRVPTSRADRQLLRSLVAVLEALAALERRRPLDLGQKRLRRHVATMARHLIESGMDSDSSARERRPAPARAATRQLQQTLAGAGRAELGL